MRLLTILMMLASFLSAGCTPAPTTPSAPVPVPVCPAHKVKLLLFTQKGCKPCVRLKAQLHDAAVRDEMARFEFEEVQPPDRRFLEYKVKQTPTLLALTAHGTERWPGGTLGQLAAWLNRLAEQCEKISGKITEGGLVSPDAKAVIVCDLPQGERKKNIASKGLGCCVFRSLDYAAHWQQVPELYELPEQMVKAGIPGGGFPQKVDDVIKRFGPHVQYIQDTSGDPAILEAILKTGRMPCVTYNGHDPHYGNQTIAHMTNILYFDRQTGWACVLDNNFPQDNQLLWMSCEDFCQRWKRGAWNGPGGSGWVVALLNAPPPPVPHN